MNKLTTIISCLSSVSLSVALAVTGACVDDGVDDSYDSSEQRLDNAPQPILDLARGSKVVMSARHEQELVESGMLQDGSIAHAGETIIYMNRTGGQFSPGNNNSSTNATSLGQSTFLRPI